MGHSITYKGSPEAKSLTAIDEDPIQEVLKEDNNTTAAHPLAGKMPIATPSNQDIYIVGYKSDIHDCPHCSWPTGKPPLQGKSLKNYRDPAESVPEKQLPGYIPTDKSFAIRAENRLPPFDTLLANVKTLTRANKIIQEEYYKRPELPRNKWRQIRSSIQDKSHSSNISKQKPDYSASNEYNIQPYKKKLGTVRVGGLPKKSREAPQDSMIIDWESGNAADRKLHLIINAIQLAKSTKKQDSQSPQRC